MLIDVEPNVNVSGGAIGGSDPSAIEMTNELMDRVVDFV
jgi:hypothetical protein